MSDLERATKSYLEVRELALQIALNLIICDDDKVMKDVEMKENFALQLVSELLDTCKVVMTDYTSCFRGKTIEQRDREALLIGRRIMMEAQEMADSAEEFFWKNASRN